MLLYNVESDLKTRLEKEGITQKELAGQIGVSLPYVNRITRGREQLVNKTFLKMMDELGYDVELTYKKKAAEWCVDNSGVVFTAELKLSQIGDEIREKEH